MTLQRMEHVGIVVADLAAATEFFAKLGLELQGKGQSRANGEVERHEDSYRLGYVRGAAGIIAELAEQIG